MRYESEQKSETRARIVRNASRKLRAEGLSGPGVASLMKASGLTVGGFYKHFRSKDELLVDAIAQGFSDFDQKILSLVQNVPREERWKEFVRWYLSAEHSDHRESGCPVAALAPDIARAKISVRRRFASWMTEWAEFMPGATATEREQNFFVIFGAMMGALSIARMFTDPEDRQKVLDGMREHLLRSF